MRWLRVFIVVVCGVGGFAMPSVAGASGSPSFGCPGITEAVAEHRSSLTAQQVVECDPQAVFVTSSSAVSRSGVDYAVPLRGGYLLTGFTTSPAGPAGADPCAVQDDYFLDVGVSLHLDSDLCYNGSKAWAVWSTTRCDSIPGASCNSHTSGVIYNYTTSMQHPCDPWANWQVTLELGFGATHFLRQYQYIKGYFTQWAS